MANKSKENKTKSIYGLDWPVVMDPLAIEMKMIRAGGHLQGGGAGLEFHFKAALRLVWPQIVFHKWVDMFIKEFLTKRTVTVIGPASSGKTCMAAFCVLLDYYCWPSCTTILCCSTTRELLEQRIWGEIKGLHKSAKERFEWLPGNFIESRLRIVTDSRNELSEGRDFRNGIVGVACLKGDSYVGLSSFVGVKNKRVTLLVDELSLMPRIITDAISNLDKNPHFIFIGLGNPKDTTDALGTIAEPAAYLGGWDGNIDQEPRSKVWETRRSQGVCLQLVGSDSPNLDGKLGIPLISQEAIDRDISFYGIDSVHYTMMNQGMMPRGQGSRRVITRQMCQKFGARNEPQWLNADRTLIAFLDAAYRGVGGDRCVFGILEFGEEMNQPEEEGSRITSSLVNQPNPLALKRKILALKSTMVVPIVNSTDDLPEDQIVRFVMARCAENKIPPENFFYDSGMRTSLVQALGRVWSANTMSVDCGGKPTERKVSHDIDVKCCDYYSKFITELWYSVRLIIEARQFRGMTEDVMMEFASREWGMVGNNKIEVEPKEEMKKKTGRSPDLADAVAVGVYGAITRGFTIRRLDNPKQARIDHRWKTEARKAAKDYWGSGQMVSVSS